MGYFTFALSTLFVLVALGTLLHLQFGRTGIVNFGVVGFFGVGMYAFGILTVQYELGYWSASLLTLLIGGLVSALVGWLIRGLSAEETLVSTLAFATILAHLVTSEKWLTNGVAGLGTLPYPFDLGRSTGDAFLGVIAIVSLLVVAYAWRVNRVAYGRLLHSIKDDEGLAQGLGKQTARHKLVLFALTGTGMVLVGVLYGSANQFLVPRLLTPALTFTVWIALVLGGRNSPWGAILGVLVSAGLFDLLIEPFVRLPADYSQLLPDMKLMLFGLILIVVIMFRPSGMIRENREGKTA